MEIAVDRRDSVDLTVITVCYNARAALPSCVDSIAPLLRSDDLQVEYLVIDGASEDGTREFLRERQSRGDISWFVSEPDQGIYDAMNKGISMASGRVTVFINADDEICSEAVADCCRPILEGKARFTLASSELLGAGRMPCGILRPDISKSLLGACCCHQSLYCETELLREFGGFDFREFPLIADAALMTRFFAGGIPYEVVQRVASRFLLGGASAAASVHLEGLRLLLRNREDILAAAGRDSAVALNALREIYRYALRWLRFGDGEFPTPVIQGIHRIVGELLSSMPVGQRKGWLRHARVKRAEARFLKAVIPGKFGRKQGLICEVFNLMLP